MKGEDRWMQILAFLGMLRNISGTPESQIHTQEQVDPRVRSTLPRMNALNVFIAFMGAMLGIYLISGGIAWFLDLDWDPRSFLVVWIGVGLMAMMAASGAKRWLSKQVRLVQSFAAVFSFLVLGLAVGSLLLTVRESYNPWRLLGMAAGAGLILSSLALGYNQFMEVVEPYWRQSPFERAIASEVLPLFKVLLNGEEEPETVEVDPITTYRRIMTRNDEPRRREEEDPWPVDIVEEPKAVIRAETGNLLWFAAYAARMPGLSIRDLTIHPAPLLPFPEGGKEARLRRGMIRRLLARGSTSGEVFVDGHREIGLGENGWWELQGQGATAEWAVEQSIALRDAMEMWREAMGDQPFPDYWATRDYEAAA